MNDYEVHQHEKSIWNTEKKYDQHRKLELNPPEKKRIKGDDLEAPLKSSWESSDKNIERKRNEEASHQ